MKPTREELLQSLRDMSDEELSSRIRSAAFTEEARELALAESALRGLPGEAEEAASPALGPLQICTRFLLPMDAEIFAARLQAEGIAGIVMDSNTVYSNGAFHTSLALGGVRVMVPASQLADAQRVLAAFNAGEYAIGDDFDPNAS